MEDAFKPITEEKAKELAAQPDDDSLASALAGYREALQQEYQIDSEGAAEQVREKFVELEPEAYAAVDWLVKNADSESVRLSAAKFIYTVILGKELGNGKTDSLGKLIEDLTKSNS